MPKHASAPTTRTLKDFLTHGHELGYIPAAALVHILHILSHNEDVDDLEAIRELGQGWVAEETLGVNIICHRA